jgi:hypothetical protein
MSRKLMKTIIYVMIGSLILSSLLTGLIGMFL